LRRARIGRPGIGLRGQHRRERLVGLVFLLLVGGLFLVVRLLVGLGLRGLLGPHARLLLGVRARLNLGDLLLPLLLGREDDEVPARRAAGAEQNEEQRDPLAGAAALVALVGAHVLAGLNLDQLGRHL